MGRGGRDSDGERASLTLDRDDYTMDGGRAWLVMAAGMLATGTTSGLVNGFGIFARRLGEDLAVGGGLTSLAGGICAGLVSFAGIPGAAIYTLIGPRLGGYLGSATAVLGFLSAAYAPSMYCLLGSFALVGTGFGIALISINSAQTQYFRRYRSLVLALMTAGGALGTLTVPRLLFVLIDTFGWRNSVLIYAGFTGFFFLYATCARSRRRRRYSLRLAALLKPGLFTQANYCIFVGAALCWGGAVYAVFLMVTRLGPERDLGPSGGADLLFCIGVTNLVGRVSAAFLVQAKWVRKLLFHGITTGLWTLGILLLSLLRPAWALLVAAGIFGAGYGLFNASVYPLLLELVGVGDYPQASGMYNAFGYGLGVLLITYPAGALSDAVGVLTVLYILFGIGVICVAVSAFLAFRLSYAKSPSEESTSEESVSPSPKAK